MGRLTVDGINPILAMRGWRSLLWVIRGASWEVTCGFCRTRFRRATLVVREFSRLPRLRDPQYVVKRRLVLAADETEVRVAIPFHG